jgi:hypothetical protein
MVPACQQGGPHHPVPCRVMHHGCSSLSLSRVLLPLSAGPLSYVEMVCRAAELPSCRLPSCRAAASSRSSLPCLKQKLTVSHERQTGRQSNDMAYLFSQAGLHPMDVSLYILPRVLMYMPPHTVLCVYIIIHYHHTTLQLYLTGIQYLYTDMVIYGIWPHNTYSYHVKGTSTSSTVSCRSTTLIKP